MVSRVMPEVPVNIQDNLAEIEDRAAGMGHLQESHSTRGRFPGRGDSLATAGPPPPPIHQGQHEVRKLEFGPGSANPYEQATPVPGSYPQNEPPPPPQPHPASYVEDSIPNFSPFPQLRNPPPNVPPSDEEKEATLERSRTQVLESDDPEMQLAWAQDALAYVEVAIQHEARLSEHRPGRSQTPQVEHQLRIDAVGIVSFLAEQGHPKAEFMRGMWLEFGKFGLRVDKKEAYRCYVRAAEKGYPRAEYRIGMQYESSNDPNKAIRHYLLGVDQADSASNYRLGMMVLLGQHGQTQDYARGLDHIKFAADTADENAPQGAYVYGMLLARELENIAIPAAYLRPDLHEARVYIEKAAYLGFAKAQVKMGAAYELCQLGCDFNPALSLHYNALAARQGEAAAEMAVSKWFLCGFEGVFEKNEELAFVFAQRAARAGLPTAEFAMGYFYEIGVYVGASVEDAKGWYQKAAAHGNGDAVARIEGISRSKTLSKRDHEQVAIQRIRSQYGSQRGKRPTRFRTPAEPMPSIPDAHLQMPEPGRGPGPGPGPGPRPRPRPGLGPGPARTTTGSSVRPHLQTSAMPPRAQSAMGAPYPLEDGPPRHGHGHYRPGTATGYVGSQARASSAMGNVPYARPATAAIPSTSPDSATSPHGRPFAAGPDHQPPTSLDAMSISDRSRPGSTSSAQTGQYLRRPTSAMDASRIGLNDKPLPRLDIGFSAPADPNIGHRNRLHKQPPSSGRPPQQQPEAYAGGPSSPQQHPTRPPTVRPSSSQSLGAPAVSTRPSRTRPTSTDMPSVQEENQRAPSVPPPQPPQHQQQQQLHPDAVAPRPVGGKGPKTFDEMGVPQAPKESECVRFSLELGPLTTDVGADRTSQVVM